MKKIRIFEWVFAIAFLLATVLLFRVSWTIVNGNHVDPWGWSALEAVGTWAGAVATATAVAVALWTAQRSDIDQRRRDDTKARLTALRYSKDLMHYQSVLSAVLKWARERPGLLPNVVRDISALKPVEDLNIDPSFDDLYLLAPLPDDFAIRLHNLLPLFMSLKKDANSLQRAITDAYAVQIRGGQEYIARADLHLSISLDSFGNRIEEEKAFVDRLLADSLKAAYSEIAKGVKERVDLASHRT